MSFFNWSPNSTLEKTSTSTTIISDCNVPFLPLFALFINFFFLSVIEWFGILARLVPKLGSFILSDIYSESVVFVQKSRCLDRDIDSESLRREEVETVMNRLGLFCITDERLIKESSFGCDNISKVFDDDEPSLEEIKQAFDLFDENRDGFIDAAEIQRVLRLLGVGHVADIERCKRMIENVDANGDKKIDFYEFVKFMETILC